VYRFSFMEHDLKGVLTYRRRNLDHPTDRYGHHHGNRDRHLRNIPVAVTGRGRHAMTDTLAKPLRYRHGQATIKDNGRLSPETEIYVAAFTI
jgi:hypothetical protein